MSRRVSSACIRLVAACLITITVLGAPTQGVRHSAAAAPWKHISISLVRQRLRAWEGKKVVLSTPVTTGDSLLPTPTGHFSVFAKYSPYTFISPWAYGSRFWYPPSTANFAMEFISGGYFIHDAPWRSVYGKGSNVGDQPGTNYGGTHGCVNVPYSAMRFLYYWATYGTPVHVVR